MTLKDVINADVKNVFMNPNDFAFTFLNDRTRLEINVIFDNQFVVVIEDVEDTAPAITVADTDVLSVARGDIFTDMETAIVYNVVGIQPDNTGFTILILSQD
jgi:hypothetical protein